ncbi:dynein regulatory complex subunit 3 [Cheilinus undulatus]|uniref:dynein regulatory complex subunit 3 n=1 Tax=Cheilinus undulatus TaxID=241271 RepID=UPI001BD25A58|nr:dynein regulatory complex subunit 3 [Cheilinus undulatus]
MNSPCLETMPVLMDEEMLNQAVMKQAKHEVKLILNQEGIHFNKVRTLCLTFKKILRIDSLWEFTSLNRLDLSNNNIEKIEGLDRLLNLTWLDLSFNKLEKIEGLESLRKLEVLNLSNNRISVIENLDNVEALAHFCIGNNLIGQLDNVLYLRKFKLYTLILSGNPASEGDDYKLFIAAYFPTLTYLDNKLLDKQTKTEASVKYHVALDKLRLEELQKQAQDVYEISDKDDFLVFLKGSYLSESLHNFDPNAKTLHCVPEMAEEMEEYPFHPFSFEQQMLKLSTQIVEVSLAESQHIEKEMKDFTSAQSKVMKDHQKEALQVLTDFEEQHKQRMEELQQMSDLDLMKEKISHCNDEIHRLCNSFMEMESLHLRQMEDVIKKLDGNLSEMVQLLNESVHGLFSQCQDLEDSYYENMKKISFDTLEKGAKDMLEYNMLDDAENLLTDRDAVIDVLDTAHQNHLQRISDRETQLVTRVSAWKKAHLDRIQDEELDGNQTRLSDCNRYAEFLREQLEGFW